MRNDSIFYYRPDPNAFLLEFDFSANPGDTIRIPLHEVNSPNEIVHTELIVYSIKIIESHGVQLRDFFVHALGNNWAWYHRFTERIGSPTGIPIGYFTVASPLPSLRCYADQEVMLNFTSQDCEYLLATKTKEEHYNQLINIYPNPGIDYWKVEAPIELVGVTYKIWSSQGQIMKSGILNKEVKIESSQFPAGLYFLVAHHNQQQILVRLLKI